MFSYRYCSRCMVYRKTDAHRCPECGVTMRSKPKKKKKDVNVILVKPDDAEPIEKGVEAV